jgi:hypothetical protein
VDATPYAERVQRFTAAPHPAAWLADLVGEQLTGDLDDPDDRRAALLEALANGARAATRLRSTVLAATDLVSVTVRVGDGQLHLRELPTPLALLNLCGGNAAVGDDVEVTQRFADGSTSTVRDRWPLDLALAEELVHPSAGNLRRFKADPDTAATGTRLYMRNLRRFGKVGLSVNTGPPTWWLPRPLVSGPRRPNPALAVGGGWLRLAVTIHWVAADREPSPEGALPPNPSSAARQGSPDDQ